jgi:transposase
MLPGGYATTVALPDFARIRTYLRIPITNAAGESVNSKIHWFRYQARGFRNEARFMRSILFHFGGLD